MPNIGPLELGIVLVIVLLLFGASRVPAVAKSLGSGLREFKDSVTEMKDSVTGKRDGDEDSRPEKLERPDSQDRTNQDS